MTSALLLALSATVAVLACVRALRAPVLRPAALGLVAYTAIDVARLWAGPRADVILFCALPGVVGAIIGRSKMTNASGLDPGGIASWEDLSVVSSRRSRPTGLHVPHARPAEPKTGSLYALTPLFATGIYGIALAWFGAALAPWWAALLAAPRVAAFGLAAWVGLRRPVNASVRAGVVLAVSDGCALAAGLWATWADVRWLSTLAWIVVAAIVIRTERGRG